jgi:hypothetical protein
MGDTFWNPVTGRQETVDDVKKRATDSVASLDDTKTAWNPVTGRNQTAHDAASDIAVNDRLIFNPVTGGRVDPNSLGKPPPTPLDYGQRLDTFSGNPINVKGWLGGVVDDIKGGISSVAPKTSKPVDAEQARWDSIYQGMNDATNAYKSGTDTAIDEYSRAGMENAKNQESLLQRKAAEMSAQSGASGYGGAASAGAAQAALGGMQLQNSVSGNAAQMKMDEMKGIMSQRKAMLDAQYDQAKTEGNQALMLKIETARNKFDVLSSMASSGAITNYEDIVKQMNG